MSCGGENSRAAFSASAPQAGGVLVVMAIIRVLAAAALLTMAAADPDVVSFPSYASLQRASRSAPEAEYELARADARFEMLKLTYPSDGLRVVAFVYRPLRAAAPLPVIIYNRGSYVRNDAAPELLPAFHRLAAAGFVVVAPMYRGSEGAEGRDDMGGADLADLMNVQSLITTLPYADRTRLFLYGESRGGMMVLQALRDGFPARAAATFGAFTDLGAYLSSDPAAATVARQIWPDFERNQAAILERRSAVRWAERIRTPLLIMHGGADRGVNPSHAIELASLLQHAGHPYELLIVAGAGHTLQPFQSDRDEHAVRWFRRHLGS
jgi:dipeptidyl aminopeptidase/acylaminoacyl peptidase